MKQAVQDTLDRFKSEEVASSYGYASGYDKPKSIIDQITALSQLFPDINFPDNKLVLGKIPEIAEGWFVIPRYEAIAPAYNEALAVVLDQLRLRYSDNFSDYREEPGVLRQTEKSANAWRRVGRKQRDCDTLLVPAQFGFQHRGQSMRRARQTFASNEFGLGVFMVGIMILTHPERIEQHDDLWIDCAGDEYSPSGDGVFSCAPIFRRYKNQLELDFRPITRAGGSYGTASAFVP